MHPPACPMALSREHNSLTVSNLSLSIIALVEKGLSAPAKVEQVLQINSLQFLKFYNNNRIVKEEESVDILKIIGLINIMSE